MIYRYEKVTNYDKVLHDIGVLLGSVFILIGGVISFIVGYIG